MSEIRVAKFADALALADRLRFEDAREIASSWGVGAREGLFHCLMQSDRAFTLFEEGEPEALWGVTGVNEQGLSIGIPWMLAGERLFERKRGTLSHSRRVIDHLLLDYHVLTNLTDASNSAHLRWLAWCGFVRLRRHEGHGAAGRAFVEFYRINERRDVSDLAVRAILKRRTPARPNLSNDDAVGRLVGIGIRVLDRWGEPGVAVLEELAQVLRSLGATAAADSRARRACVRLMLEIAVRVSARLPRNNDMPFGRHTPLGELLGALADVADQLVLDGCRDAADIVLALEASRRSGPAADGKERASAGVRSARGGGAAAFQWLVRRYVRMLTIDGRVSRSHGYRLWAAAVGAGGESVQHPLGMDRSQLWQLLRDCRLTDTLKANAAARMSELDDRRRALLDRPVGHGRAMARMRAVCDPDDPLDQRVMAQIDAWAFAGDGAPAPVRGGIHRMGDAVSAVSAIADRAALQVFPSLRLGGIVSGYADRHWLYQLLRVRLLLAASGSQPDELGLLLAEDITGMLLAARLEDRLLGESSAAPAPAEVETLLREALSLWPRDIAVDDELGYLVGLLLSAMAVPVVHAVQLAPALLAWHLLMAGRLDEALRGVGDVVGNDGFGSRLGYRKFLRTLTRGIDIVTFVRHLGMHVDVEASTPHTPLPFVRGR